MDSLGVLYASLLLAASTEFKGTPLPRKYQFGQKRQCYRNAGLLCLDDPELRYCEGYALPEGLFPVHHAWCVARDGTVVDSTWPDGKAHYRGLVFDRDFMQQHWESGVWALWAEMPSEAMMKVPLAQSLDKEFRPHANKLRAVQRAMTERRPIFPEERESLGGGTDA